VQSITPQGAIASRAIDRKSHVGGCATVNSPVPTLSGVEGLPLGICPPLSSGLVFGARCALSGRAQR